MQVNSLVCSIPPSMDSTVCQDCKAEYRRPSDLLNSRRRQWRPLTKLKNVLDVSMTVDVLLQVVMPPLLHSAQLKPDVHITDLESTSDNEDEDDEVRLRVLHALPHALP